MKKTAALILVLFLALFACFAVAESEAITEGDYAYCVNEDGTCTILACKSTEAEITIPETIDGYTVSALGECVFYDGYGDNETLKKVIVPACVRKIANEAFWNCTALETVVLNEGLESIGVNAFGNCSELKELAIPESVIEILGNPASGAGNLESVTVSEKQSKFQMIDGCLYDTEKCALLMCPSNFSGTCVILEGTKVIAESAFARCAELTSVVIPEGITEVGESAFAFSNVRDVEFPEGLTKIGKMAFFFCAKVEQVKIPESVNEIGSMAFYVAPANKNTIILAKLNSYAYDWAKENKVKVDFYR